MALDPNDARLQVARESGQGGDQFWDPINKVWDFPDNQPQKTTPKGPPNLKKV
jgi:hypothetical protein